MDTTYEQLRAEAEAHNARVFQRRAEWNLTCAAFRQKQTARLESMGFRIGDHVRATCGDILTGGLLGRVTYTGPIRMSKRGCVCVHTGHGSYGFFENPWIKVV